MSRAVKRYSSRVRAAAAILLLGGAALVYANAFRRLPSSEFWRIGGVALVIALGLAAAEAVLYRFGISKEHRLVVDLVLAGVGTAIFALLIG